MTLTMPSFYPGTTAVCSTCGEVYYKTNGHNCPRKK